MLDDKLFGAYLHWSAIPLLNVEVFGKVSSVDVKITVLDVNDVLWHVHDGGETCKAIQVIDDYDDDDDDDDGLFKTHNKVEATEFVVTLLVLDVHMDL